MTTQSFERPVEAGFADLVIGINYGDEGKGNTVDRLVSSGVYDMVARFNGGANAGHQLYFNGQEIALHQVPSGIAHNGILNIIGNGSYVDPVGLLEEFDAIRNVGLNVSPLNLAISDTSHFVLPHQKIRDRLREAGDGRQGSTAKGIAFVGADKYERIGARPELMVWDPDKLRTLVVDGLEQTNAAIAESGLSNKIKDEKGLRPVNTKQMFETWVESARALQPYLTDTFPLIHERLEAGQNLLAEGAQSTGLDIEQGIYPLGTSSHATPGGMMNGLGIGPHQTRNILGVQRMKISRVGGEDGPFVTKVENERIATRVRGKRGDVDGDFGKSTGRPREVGYPDNTLAKRARGLGVTHLVLTQLDLVPRFGSEVKIATAYDMNGERIEYAPNSAAKLAACKAIYETFPTWKQDISGIRNYSELPVEARNLVEFVEEDVRLPVVAIGVGPSREQVIFKDTELAEQVA